MLKGKSAHVVVVTPRIDLTQFDSVLLFHAVFGSDRI
jgi:hypothetical protein